MKARNPAPHVTPECETLRLAQGDVATIDMCSCGTLRLNFGALTVRLTPEALSSLMQTVGEGLATHAALRARPRFVAEALPSATSRSRPPKASREGCS
jgi:hypothetical protein